MKFKYILMGIIFGIIITLSIIFYLLRKIFNKCGKKTFKLPVNISQPVVENMPSTTTFMPPTIVKM